jgi:hypothetical protein
MAGSAEAGRQAKAGGGPHRDPAEVREYEVRVWDLTRHLIHPAFLYVVLQVALWCGLERCPAFRGPGVSFWERTGIHVLQFLGAWGIFYGTLLRDMRIRSIVPTIVLWLAAAGALAVWVWPDPERPEAWLALRTLFAVELAAGFVGWFFVMVTWLRAKARHEQSEPGGGA